MSQAIARWDPRHREKPRNFLISYSGRVGSSALIDTLKAIPGFLVPLFEDLDYWHIEQHGKLDEHTEATIHHAVDYAYRTIPEGVDPAGTSVGFKWRIWGDMDRVSDVLRDHGVVVLNMVRCDIVEYVASLYLSDIVNREFNAPQFMLRDAANEAERLEILFKYRMQTCVADPEAYFNLYGNQLRMERERLDVLARLRRDGHRVCTIFYEDFAYRRYRFLNALLRLLNHKPLDRLPMTRLSKVATAYPSELFSNRAELLADARMTAALREWDELVCRPRDCLAVV
jgi:hypothetical protein